jgi:hypothetical protein
MGVKNTNASSSLVEVVDRILDAGFVIDKFKAFLQSPFFLKSQYVHVRKFLAE